MDIWWLVSAASVLFVLALCVVLCCSISRGGYARVLNLDDVPPIAPLPAYPDPLDETSKYPLPPPCDPAMIPFDFISSGDKFPSVTGKITTDYVYAE
jgi:hypothetical protein